MTAPIVAVAYSGGRDSSALLHATLAAAAEVGINVVALHVHHGLMAQADAWLCHCEQQCRRWATRGKPVRFAYRRLSGKPAKGDSVEAWARQARYVALREMALEHGASVVLLAHHRQDQAETLLLQALRGAGVAGLAAMPKSVERAGVTWLRPWLEMPRALVEAYVRRHRLRYIEDDSNVDARFARSRLRLDVWPGLQAAFPAAEKALADTARWAREAQLCVDELGAMDLAGISDATGLKLELWVQLSLARRSNALRAWLKQHLAVYAPATLVQRLIAELPGTAPAQWPVGTQTLRRYRGRLQCLSAVSPKVTVLCRERALAVTCSGTYALPGWGGSLRVRRVKKGGVPLSSVAELRLVMRAGREQFQSEPGRPPRALKKQFQALAVPAWERDGPLLYSAESLVYVPGLGVDARVWAASGVPQVGFEWLADARS